MSSHRWWSRAAKWNEGAGILWGFGKLNILIIMNDNQKHNIVYSVKVYKYVISLKICTLPGIEIYTGWSKNNNSNYNNILESNKNRRMESQFFLVAYELPHEVL